MCMFVRGIRETHCNACAECEWVHVPTCDEDINSQLKVYLDVSAFVSRLTVIYVSADHGLIS